MYDGETVTTTPALPKVAHREERRPDVSGVPLYSK